MKEPLLLRGKEGPLIVLLSPTDGQQSQQGHQHQKQNENNNDADDASEINFAAIMESPSMMKVQEQRQRQQSRVTTKAQTTEEEEDDNKKSRNRNVLANEVVRLLIVANIWFDSLSPKRRQMVALGALTLFVVIPIFGGAIVGGHFYLFETPQIPSRHHGDGGTSCSLVLIGDGSAPSCDLENTMNVTWQNHHIGLSSHSVSLAGWRECAIQMGFSAFPLSPLFHTPCYYHAHTPPACQGVC